MSTHRVAFSPDAAALAPTQAAPNRTLAADLLDRVVAARDLDEQRCLPPTWLWHGYLGPGKVTLLTSQWKSGKTTLVSLLLAAMNHGGQLAGLPVVGGKAFVISEESESDWRPRFKHLGIRDNVDLLCRPFTRQPTMDDWLALVDAALAMHDRQGSNLVVIDSLAYFLPAHCENSASALLECLTPMQRLSAAGMCILLLHHPRKGKTVAGQAARGTGALPSFVDIIMEMGHYTLPDDQDRRRRLVAFSRHDETPRHLLMELQPSGTDYVVVQSDPQAALGDGWPAVVYAMAKATTKLTRQDILENWLPDYAKPDATTLWRWLSRAAAQGLVRQEGTGRPGDRFRYWLPEREELMRPDLGSPADMAAWNDRCVADLLRRLNATPAAPPAQTAPQSESEIPTPSPASAALPVEATSHDPLPGPDSAAPTVDVAPPSPDLLPPPASLPLAPQPPIRLPYPFNMMDPADVPEAVWNQARQAQKPTR